MLSMSAFSVMGPPLLRNLMRLFREAGKSLPPYSSTTPTATSGQKMCIRDRLWAMTTRYQGDLDTLWLPGVRGHVLDPTQSPLYDARIPARGVGCKAVFDCTVPVSYTHLPARNQCSVPARGVPETGCPSPTPGNAGPGNRGAGPAPAS